MSEIENLPKFIKDLCDEYSLYLVDVSAREYRIFTDSASGVTMLLEVKDLNNFSFHFSERTYDIVHRGDRTDVHVVISLMFASFLQAIDLGVVCSLFDIAHPVVGGEIYGRYMMPVQTPALLGISNWEQLKEAIRSLIRAIAFWRETFWFYAGCPCEECEKNTGIRNERSYDVSEELTKCIDKFYKNSNRVSVNKGARVRPDWEYLYDMENEVTIIKSIQLSTYMQAVKKLSRRAQDCVDGIHGKLTLDGELRNFIRNKDVKEVNKLMNYLLNYNKIIDLHIVALDNMIIAVSSPYIIALGRLCGENEFKNERELLRERHNKESLVLFPITLFEWNDDICPDQFELLIKLLLERELNVKYVRKPAPLNQGDKGRDLIIEWNILNPYVMSKVNPPISVITVVGQCKASNKTIGKDKVVDIRDTIETHNASGFFLAVSTQISAPLTEKLESLRAKGIWTEWWNRDDIESRLSKNQDLIPRFPKVLRPKNKVKFLDKEGE